MNAIKSYPEFVKARFLKRNIGPEGLMHAAIGIIGEVVEWYEAKTFDHRVEELGDIEFYLEAASQGIGPGLYNEAMVARRSLLYLAADLLDLAKKSWVYGKEIDPVLLRSLLADLHHELGVAYHSMATTREFVIQANITKLLKRFPEGYTDELAIARLDKTGLKGPETRLEKGQV